MTFGVLLGKIYSKKEIFIPTLIILLIVSTNGL
jgi:hypothetical protein